MIEWCKELYTARISTPLMRVLTRFRWLTPNMVTIFNHGISLTCGVYCFSRGSWLWNIAGVGVMIIIGIIDYADGDLAKRTGRLSPTGVWFDSVFDVMIQNIIAGAILIGCYKQGLSVFWIVLYFVNNAGNNLVSFYYNHQFGFSSHTGSDAFRTLMLRCKRHWEFNQFLKNLIDPTSSYIGLVVFTLRYAIVIGAFFNLMPLCLILVTIIGNFRWLVMYILFALHLRESKLLWVNQVLAILDDERGEHYAV